MPKSTHPREALKSIVSGDTPGYVRALFDSIAEEYDRMNWVMTGGLYAFWHRAFAKATRLAPGESGLDVCSGHGRPGLHHGRAGGSERPCRGPRLLREDAQRSRKRERSGRKRPARPSSGCKATPWSSPSRAAVSIRALAVTMGFALRNVADIQRTWRRWPGWPGREGTSSASRSPGRRTRSSASVSTSTSTTWYPPWPDGREEPPEEGGARTAGPYTYLPYSLEHLPPPEEILEMMRSAGLTDCIRRPLTGGVVTLYIGVKN